MEVKSIPMLEEASLPGKPPSGRQLQEWLAGRLFLLATGLPVVLIASMVIGLYLRSRPILAAQPLWQLLSGQTWRPLQGQFGYHPFIIGTLWVTILAMVLAVPPCFLSAVYLSEYARPATRSIIKPLLDLLAGIPSVVYGVWGLVAIVPWVQETLIPLANSQSPKIPLLTTENPTGYGILTGSIVLAVMVAPVIISVIFEVFQAVPDDLRGASLSLGATRWQTIRHALLPKTTSGVLAAIVLGFSRAFGETMAVLMVVGNVAQPPASILDPAYPLTALIANNYGEMLSIPLYDSALMGAALILLVVILAFNLISTVFLNRLLRRAR